MLVRARGLGDDDDARRVAVEPVDDARPERAAAGELPEVEGERVGERARRHPGRGVDDEPGGLVDDDELFVFVDDVERNLFGRDLGQRRRRVQLDLDVLAPLQLERGLRHR